MYLDISVLPDCVGESRRSALQLGKKAAELKNVEMGGCGNSCFAQRWKAGRR